MRNLFFVVLVLLVFSSVYALNCTYVEYYVDNLTAGANVGKINFEIAKESLQNSAKAYGCTGKGILVIEGDDIYTYSINDSSIGDFYHKIFLEQNGTYKISATKEGYIPQSITINLSAGEYKEIHFSLQQNTTTTSTTSSGGGGPAPNVYYKLDKDSISNYLSKLAAELNLNKNEVEYQKKVYSYVPFEVKYIRVSVGGANSLYYYFKNDWNQTVKVRLIMVIPKEIAKNLNGVSIVAGYKVIKEDPILEWDYDVSPGKEVRVGYTITGNITIVEPLVVLFENVSLPNIKPKVETTVQKPKANEENITENVTNKTVQEIPPKSTFNFNWLLLVIIVSTVSASFVGYYLYRRKKRYEELQEALNALDTLFKTHRRR